MEKLEQKVYAIKEQAKDAANAATAKTKKSADKIKRKGSGKNSRIERKSPACSKYSKRESDTSC